VAAASAAPLSLLALGTAMVACTYPVLIALYAKKEFKPVLLVQLACVLLFFPLLLWFSDSMGILGAALCWSIYGVGLFATYSTLTAARHGNRLSLGLLGSFISAVILSLVVGWPIKHFFGQNANHGEMLGLIGVTLVGAWLLTASACTKLRHGLGRRLKAIQISMNNHQ
jgi:O-antigen/teichoic acid export membrane protein